MLLLCAPFGLTAAISQYTSTLGSYEYAAINAYNFWGLLGMNWVDQNTIFLFLPCKTWGTIVILLIVPDNKTQRADPVRLHKSGWERVGSG